MPENEDQKPAKKLMHGERVDAYVEARSNGHSQSEAKEIAGYAPSTSPVYLEGGLKAQESIQKALKKRGIDDDWLAKQYEESLEECSDTFSARLKDLNAKASLLKGLGYLMGHGKNRPQPPSVAVQINNTPGKAVQDELGATSELIAEVRDLVTAIRTETETRKPDELHAGDSKDGHAAPHPGVDPPSSVVSDVGRGGGT